MGSTNRIWVEVDVYNNGEDSYESMLYMTVPKGLSYVNFDRLDTSKDVPILCSAPTASSNNTLKCDIGNPLPTYSKAHFRLYFQPRYGSEVKSSYDFYVVANSTNPEETYAKADNARVISMPIRVQTDMKVVGASHPQPVRHNASQFAQYAQKEKNEEADVGPEVIHVYEVKCEGPSDIANAEVTILWPSYTLTNKHFLYLLEQPVVEGPAECDHVDDVNPLALIIQRHNKFESYSLGSKYSTSSTHHLSLDTEESSLAGVHGSLKEDSDVAGGHFFTDSENGRDQYGRYYNHTTGRHYHRESSQASGGVSRTYNYNYTQSSRSYSSRGGYSRASDPDEYDRVSTF